MPNLPELVKASWKDIERGAALPPSDNSDVATSGLATENTYPPNAAKDLPDNTANKDTGSPGPDAKGHKDGPEFKMSKKAMASINKILQDDEHATAALDYLESKGIFKAMTEETKSEEQKEFPPQDEEEDEEKEKPKEEEKAYKAVASLNKKLDTLAVAFSNFVKAQAQPKTSEIQKQGFIEVQGTTGKPGMAQLEKQPAYSSRQADLQKAVGQAEDSGRVPSFQDLARKPLGGVWN